MKKQLLIALIVSILFLPSCYEGEVSEVVDVADEIEEEQKVLESKILLEHLNTFKMTAGTHRPEILVKDNNLYLLVVDPNKDEEIQHRGYIFDASDPSDIDFDNFESFVLTHEGSDHRGIIMDDKIVIVYQVNIMSEDLPEEPISGPAEIYAESQKLMVAIFSLDGEEIFREEILSTTDFEEDSFPDMCMLSWNETSFLVSTGPTNMNPQENVIKIREVDFNSDIIIEKKYTLNKEQASNIGNSMFAVTNGFLFFSSPQSITVTEFDEELNIGDTVVIKQDNNLAYAFPTGVIGYGDYYIIGYSSHDSGNQDIESNPLYPAIMILTKDFEIVIDGQINELFPLDADPGTGHAHPTLAVINDRLFYTWSGKAERKEGPTGHMPQVRIEEFKLNFD